MEILARRDSRRGAKDGHDRAATCGSNDWPNVDLGLDTTISIHTGCPATISNEVVCSDDAQGAASSNASSVPGDFPDEDAALEVEMPLGVFSHVSEPRTWIEQEVAIDPGRARRWFAWSDFASASPWSDVVPMG